MCHKAVGIISLTGISVMLTGIIFWYLPVFIWGLVVTVWFGSIGAFRLMLLKGHGYDTRDSE